MSAPSPLAIDPSGLTFEYTDWKERVATWKPGGEDVFSVESSEATLTGIVPWNVRSSFIRYVLPFAYVSGFSLRRESALIHPYYDWLSAHSVSMKPYKPKPTDYFDGAGAVIKMPAGDPQYQFETTIYEHVEATIHFRQNPWYHIADEDVDGVTYNEWDRYTYDATREGQLDTLQQEGAVLKFAEGGPVGTQVAGTRVLQKYQDTIHLKWMHVPAEYLFGTSLPTWNLNPSKIQRCIGKVNKYEFLGYAAGTVLLQPPQWERFLWPVRTNDEAQKSSLYGYNITFPLTIFDPAKGVPASAYRGFNLFPSAAADASFGLWYYATGGTSAGDPVLGTPFIPSENFAYLFQHNDDPTVL